jgi:hypothetical protein
MARGKRASRGKPGAGEVAPPTAAAAPADKPPVNLITPTNVVVADIVLRAAGGMLRQRVEKGLLAKALTAAGPEGSSAKRSLAASAVLWGASRLARRSPLGLAVVTGGLAAKALYDRGKRLEAKRATRKNARKAPDSES